MMNLYREEENSRQKRTFKDFVDDIKLEYRTSPLARRGTLKKVSKMIHTVDAKDSETLGAICSEISGLDLCDSRYGKTLDYSDYQALLSKLKKNGKMEKEYESIAREQVCYDQAGIEPER